MKISYDIHIYAFTSPKSQLTDSQCILLPATIFFSYQKSVFLRISCMSQLYFSYIICISLSFFFFLFAYFKAESNLFLFRLYLKKHF